MTSKKSPTKILIFASDGEHKSAGGGAAHIAMLVENGLIPNAQVVGIVSTRDDGGARAHAEKCGIRFFHFKAPWKAERYKQLVEKSGAEWCVLFGWGVPVCGLDPKRTFGIHLAPLYGFGGESYHRGEILQALVFEAYKRREITRTAISMYFPLDGKLHDGFLFFNAPVPIFPNDGSNIRLLHNRVKTAGEMYYPRIVTALLQGKIHWDGADPDSVFIPKWVRKIVVKSIAPEPNGTSG